MESYSPNGQQRASGLPYHFSGRLDTREESETIAEATAYVVCAHHGLDSGSRSFPYIATWSQDPAVFKQALGSIQRVSAQIIDGLARLPTAQIPAATPAAVDVSQAPVPAVPETPGAERQAAQPLAPRDIAKALLRPYVQRGDTVAQLRASMAGMASAAFHVQIGGYAVLPGFETPETFRSVRLRPDEVAVTQVGGESCLHRFSVADLHAELLHETLQPRLF